MKLENVIPKASVLDLVNYSRAQAVRSGFPLATPARRLATRSRRQIAANYRGYLRGVTGIV